MNKKLPLAEVSLSILSLEEEKICVLKLEKVYLALARTTLHCTTLRTQTPSSPLVKAREMVA